MSWYSNIVKKIYYNKEPKVIEVEMPDDVTDEIERSLWLIKDELDLPTEEIEIAIASRHISMESKKTAMQQKQ